MVLPKISNLYGGRYAYIYTGLRSTNRRKRWEAKRPSSMVQLLWLEYRYRTNILPLTSHPVGLWGMSREQSSTLLWYFQLWETWQEERRSCNVSVVTALHWEPGATESDSETSHTTWLDKFFLGNLLSACPLWEYCLQCKALTVVMIITCRSSSEGSH